MFHVNREKETGPGKSSTLIYRFHSISRLVSPILPLYLPFSYYSSCSVLSSSKNFVSTVQFPRIIFLFPEYEFCVTYHSSESRSSATLVPAAESTKTSPSIQSKSFYFLPENGKPFFDICLTISCLFLFDSLFSRLPLEIIYIAKLSVLLDYSLYLKACTVWK